MFLYNQPCIEILYMTVCTIINSIKIIKPTYEKCSISTKLKIILSYRYFHVGLEGANYPVTKMATWQGPDRGLPVEVKSGSQLTDSKEMGISETWSQENEFCQKPEGACLVLGTLRTVGGATLWKCCNNND